jgi:hypothetical protein
MEKKVFSYFSVLWFAWIALLALGFWSGFLCLKYCVPTLQLFHEGAFFLLGLLGVQLFLVLFGTKYGSSFVSKVIGSIVLIFLFLIWGLWVLTTIFVGRLFFDGDAAYRPVTVQGMSGTYVVRRAAVLPEGYNIVLYQRFHWIQIPKAASYRLYQSESEIVWLYDTEGAICANTGLRPKKYRYTPVSGEVIPVSEPCETR